MMYRWFLYRRISYLFNKKRKCNFEFFYKFLNDFCFKIINRNIDEASSPVQITQGDKIYDG